jgi:hypothetical protein
MLKAGDQAADRSALRNMHDHAVTLSRGAHLNLHLNF